VVEFGALPSQSLDLLGSVGGDTLPSTGVDLVAPLPDPQCFRNHSQQACNMTNWAHQIRVDPVALGSDARFGDRLTCPTGWLPLEVCCSGLF
jgi:hypothetical protein